MVKYIGFFIISFAVYSFCAEYVRRQRRILAELFEMVRFCAYARREITILLRPVRELCEDFQSQILSECGFFERLREGVGLVEAFKSSREALLIEGEVSELILRLFSSLSSPDVSYGARESESLLSELSDCVLQRERGSCQNIKLARTLTATACVGILLLLI